jgi:hypothetical protein
LKENIIKSQAYFKLFIRKKSILKKKCQPGKCSKRIDISQNKSLGTPGDIDYERSDYEGSFQKLNK